MLGKGIDILLKASVFFTSIGVKDFLFSVICIFEND